MAPLFPPYTSTSLARRFPGDHPAHDAIMALRYWLYDHKTVPQVLSHTSLSRRTLYRVRERWERHGIQPLLTRVSCPSRPSYSVSVVRSILRIMARSTSFTLGCDPRVIRLIPHADPAQRGQMMQQALIALIHDLDRDLYAARGLAGLLERWYLRGEPLDVIAASVHCSTRTLRLLSQRALTLLAQRLPATLAETTVIDPWAPWLLTTPLLGRADELAALEQHLHCDGCVGLVGLAGVGKSTVAAQIADRWQRAGWTIYWLRVRPIQGAMARDVIEQLYTQLARSGAIDVTTPDSALTVQDQVPIVQEAMQRVPALLVIDDVQHLEQDDEAMTVVHHLVQHTQMIRRLFVGRTAVAPSYPVVAVEGLPSEVARELYVSLHGQITDGEWATLYRWHRGNPHLLRLLPRTSTTTTGDALPVSTIIAERVQSRSLPARRILQWLWWWDAPLPTTHPFRRVIPGPESAWQELIRHHLITAQDNTYLIHDLIRDHLQSIMNPEEWRLIRQQIAEYAARHATSQPWAYRLGYHCAVDTADWPAQIYWTSELAQWAEREVQPHQAMFWWQRQWEAAQQVADQERMISATLAGAACSIALMDGPAILGWLERLPTDLTPPQEWYAALYRVQALRIIGDYDRGLQLLQSVPLADPPPAEIDESAQWHYQVELVYWSYLQDKRSVAWQQYQQLPAPPKTSTFYQQLLYHRLGVMLAGGNYAYHDALRISRIWVKLSERSGSTFLTAQATLSLVYNLITMEQYRTAELKLCHILPSLSPRWIALQSRAALYTSEVQYYQGDFQAAHRWATIALREFEKMGHPHNYYISSIYGLIALRCGHTEQALRYFGADPAPIYQVTQCFWMAETLIALERPDAAYTYMQTMLVRPQRDQVAFWDLHVLWGKFHHLHGKTDRALRHFLRAGAHYSQSKQPVQTADTYAWVAECYLARKQPDQALHYSRQAIAKIQRYARGLLPAPRIWCIHAQALEACGQNPWVAWHAASRHLTFQAAHIQSIFSVEHFLNQPYYRDIVRSTGGVPTVTARIARARQRRSRIGQATTIHEDDCVPTE
jgi:tetratricopeptide (TPR) repeat protein